MDTTPWERKKINALGTGYAKWTFSGNPLQTQVGFGQACIIDNINPYNPLGGHATQYQSGPSVGVHGPLKGVFSGCIAHMFRSGQNNPGGFWDPQILSNTMEYEGPAVQ